MAKQFSTCFGNSPCTLISLTSTRSPLTLKKDSGDGLWDPCWGLWLMDPPWMIPRMEISQHFIIWGVIHMSWFANPSVWDSPVLFCFSEISEVRVLEIHPTDRDLGIMLGRAKVMDSCKSSCQRGKPSALNADDMHMICTWWRPWCLNFVPPSGVLESLPCENPFIGVISDKFLHELRKLGVGMRNEPLNACALAMQTMNTGF